LESLKGSYPTLSTIQNLDGDTTLKPEIKTAFKQAQIDLDSTRRVLNDLNERLPAVAAIATQKALDVNVVQESAHKDFERAEKRFQLGTRGFAFAASIVLSLMVLAITAFVVLYLNSKGKFDIRPKVVLLSGFAILLALTSYQAFQAAGATLMILVILLIAAILGLRDAKEEGTK
jgi:lipopolysaccharide export LptBFGC system permease protein LptF